MALAYCGLDCNECPVYLALFSYNLQSEWMDQEKYILSLSK